MLPHPYCLLILARRSRDPRVPFRRSGHSRRVPHRQGRDAGRCGRPFLQPR